MAQEAWMHTHTIIGIPTHLHTDTQTDRGCPPAPTQALTHNAHTPSVHTPHAHTHLLHASPDDIYTPLKLVLVLQTPKPGHMINLNNESTFS